MLSVAQNEWGLTEIIRVAAEPSDNTKQRVQYLQSAIILSRQKTSMMYYVGDIGFFNS